MCSANFVDRIRGLSPQKGWKTLPSERGGGNKPKLNIRDPHMYNNHNLNFFKRHDFKENGNTDIRVYLKHGYT
jgi:hypothetical protein